jgi:hypothetical protein
MALLAFQNHTPRMQAESPGTLVVGFQVNKFVPSAGSGRSAGSAQSGCKCANGRNCGNGTKCRNWHPRIEQTRWHQKRREAPKKTVLAPRFEPVTMCVNVTMLYNYPPHDRKALECSVLVARVTAVVELIKPAIQ